MCENSTLNDVFTNSKGQKKTNDWKGRKEKNMLLSDSYFRLGENEKALRVKDCSTYLEFSAPLSEAGAQLTLHTANFCKNRLCPLCIWRRRLKLYSQVSTVMNAICQDANYEYIFMTDTVRNCSADELNGMIDNMFSSWDKFMRRAPIKKAFKGYYRALEVTFDTDEYITPLMYYGSPRLHVKPRGNYYLSLGLTVGDKNPNFKMFHPHFHVILAVNKSYFKKSDYLTQAQITDIWQSCLGVDYIPIVNVKKFTAKDTQEVKKAVAEAAKYPVKDNDIIIQGNEDLTDFAVYYLDKALNGRRLISYGGVLKEYHKNLNLSEEIDDDLVNVNDTLRDDVSYVLYRYHWGVGVSGERNYYLISTERKVNIDVQAD